MPNIISIIVTFNPNISILEILLTTLSPQVDNIIIVDNGTSNNILKNIQTILPRNGNIIIKNYNSGIASAINTGIVEAKIKLASHVIIFDQDSIPTPNMIEELISAAVNKKNLAAIGPCYVDKRQDNPPPFVSTQGLRLIRHVYNGNDATVPVDYLISSGCLIPMEAFDKVGHMREDLFIDYVDIEWGLRAKSLGLQSYGLFSAHMEHNLGDKPFNFFGKNIPIHSPQRHYYHFRNAILLYKEPWINNNWKFVDFSRLILKYTFYSIFTKPQLKHLYMMSLGIFHGLINKSGKLNK